MKAFLILLTLSSANAFLLATRAISSPGFSLKLLQKPKAVAEKGGKKKVLAKAKGTTGAKEWRWFGRDRDSKAPPQFLKLYDGSTKLGNYPELSGFEKPKDDIIRNPYKNNSPVK